MCFSYQILLLYYFKKLNLQYRHIYTLHRYIDILESTVNRECLQTLTSCGLWLIERKHGLNKLKQGKDFYNYFKHGVWEMMLAPSQLCLGLCSYS